MKLTSSAFANGERIPRTYTCKGEGLSPPLSWTGAPDQTESLVVLCEDPDAPGGTFDHWAVYDISPGTTSLKEGVSPEASGLKQGKNDFGDIGYGPPCPPRGDGAHHYIFHIWALDVPMLDIGENPSYDKVKQAAQQHRIAGAQLTGLYER